MSKRRNRRNSSPQKQSSSRRIQIIGLGAAVLAVIGLIVLVLVNRDQGPAYEPEVTGAARAEFDRLEIDHGDVQLNTPVSSVFTVRNIGDAPLQILEEPPVILMEGC